MQRKPALDNREADATFLQEIQLMLMGNPGALNDLSKNEGPCHICNSINHPTLRCHILGADEGTLRPDIRTSLDDLKQQLMEKNKKEQREQHVDTGSDDDALLPLPLIVEEDKLDETADTDAEDDDEEERAQLVADIKHLQEGLMTILLDTPCEVNALSSNVGPCKICYNDHPTLRCRFLSEESIPSAILHRPQQLKLELEEQRKQGREMVSVAYNGDAVMDSSPTLSQINVSGTSNTGENVQAISSNSLVHDDDRIKKEGESTARAPFTVSDIPSWRFLSKAKKTEGYSSMAAGAVVEGLSANELVEANLKRVDDVRQAIPPDMPLTAGSDFMDNDTIPPAMHHRLQQLLNITINNSTVGSTTNSDVRSGLSANKLVEAQQLLLEMKEKPARFRLVRESEVSVSSISRIRDHNGGGLEVIDDCGDGPIPIGPSRLEAGFKDGKDNNGRVRGLETIDDGDEAPVPFSENKGLIHDKNDRVSELQEIDDGEEPFFHIEERTHDKDNKVRGLETIDSGEEKPFSNNGRVRGLETIDGDEAPVPFSENKGLIHDKNDRVSELQEIDDGEEPFFHIQERTRDKDNKVRGLETIDSGEEEPALSQNIKDGDNASATYITPDDNEQHTMQETASLLLRYLLWILTGIEPPLPTDDDGQSPDSPPDLPPLLNATLVDEEDQIFHVTYSQQERGTIYDATQVEEESATEVEEESNIPFWKRYRRTACAVRASIFIIIVVNTAMTFTGSSASAVTESNVADISRSLTACVCSTVSRDSLPSSQGREGLYIGRGHECNDDNELDYWEAQGFAICVYPGAEVSDDIIVEDETSFVVKMRHVESNISKDFIFDDSQLTSRSSSMSEDADVELVRNVTSQTMIFTTLRSLADIFPTLKTNFTGTLYVTGETFDTGTLGSNSTPSSLEITKRNSYPREQSSSTNIFPWNRRLGILGAGMTFSVNIDLVEKLLTSNQPLLDPFTSTNATSNETSQPTFPSQEPSGILSDEPFSLNPSNSLSSPEAPITESPTEIQTSFPSKSPIITSKPTPSRVDSVLFSESSPITQTPIISPTVPSTPSPTSNGLSEQSSQPTDSPSLQPTALCSDTPGYLDLWGGTCSEYALTGNEAWCNAYGSTGEPGQTPNENCCVCIVLVAGEDDDSLSSFQPSVAPTKSPTTSKPSMSPSKSPLVLTPIITNSPSSQSPKTANPTAEPAPVDATYNPTNKPSTANPSAKPTINPSTANPTGAQSFKPTPSPTSLPSVSPTSNPTSQPTNIPSTQPITESTKAPVTSQPTSLPSNVPSNTPTNQPSNTPTSNPSSAPTRVPTQPPTSDPTSSPSNASTPAPTSSPNTLPFVSLSKAPTSQPSNTPTSSPSNVPSSQPTSSPTALPSASPSKAPTNQPSNTPTSSPSNVPSSQPTSSPTALPSASPSKASTNQPSNTPTSSPSNVPSSQPTSSPTALPSVSPSKAPTNQPSNTPTSSPSNVPSSQPTSSPTALPSASPSKTPTNQPSNTPTSSPSNAPTPVSTTICFAADDGGENGILYNAVRDYVSQDCASNNNCAVGQTYGLPMNSWCVGSVTDMSFLFSDMSTFNEDISGWNISSVTNMWEMFYLASSFNGDLSAWNTSSVTDMRWMFRGATSFNSDLSSWNTESVTDMRYMFQAATLFNSDLSLWNTKSVTSMEGMFLGAESFTSDLSAWNTSSVFSMKEMFGQARSFNGNINGWDVSSVTDMFGMFSFTSFNGDLSAWNTSSVTRMRRMFAFAKSFNGDLSAWDTKSVTTMEGMFVQATSFNGNISAWNTSRVTDMGSMFGVAVSFNGDLSSWDISSVTVINGMFRDATDFNSDLSSWDISSVMDMESMFLRATSFNQDLCGWGDVFPYNNANNIFANSGCNFTSTPQENQRGPFCASECTPTTICFAADDGGINGTLYIAVRDYVSQDCANNNNCAVGQTYGWPMNTWCVGSVTDMSSLFRDMSTFNEDISGWDTSSVTDMTELFFVATSFNGDLSAWDTSSVTYMGNMFNRAVSFNGNLSAWDVSNVSEMVGMFDRASSFNGDLSAWNTSSVEDMGWMFLGATSFNGDLSAWDLTSVTNMRSMFWGATSFNGDLSSWNTTSVTNMYAMFRGATSFNGDLSAWSTSSVTSMVAMFYEALSFNSDLSAWDISSVTELQFMFLGATSFNGDLSAWNTISVTSMQYMFRDATSFNQDLCAWRDAFPYNNAVDIFSNSGCANKSTPQENQRGPFCASECV